MPKVKDAMLKSDTPIEDYTSDYGLWVKREDLSCPPPGPPFSKTRGVFAHIKKLDEELIGVLDTSHSQAGHAVARACQILGKKCINFYPNYKHHPGPRRPQLAAKKLGAALHPLPAGRSCILFHAAKKEIEKLGGYMMPNSLKLMESVTETAKEVANVGDYSHILLPISSGTIAAGVIKGFEALPSHSIHPMVYIIHLGYSRSHDQVIKYIAEKAGVTNDYLREHSMLVDEGYQYKDVAKPGETPPWPCNEYYDLKTFRWWLSKRKELNNVNQTLFWNIG